MPDSSPFWPKGCRTRAISGTRGPVAIDVGSGHATPWPPHPSCGRLLKVLVGALLLPSVLWAGGRGPSIQTSGTELTLYAAHFVNTQRGWAVGEGGTILRTMDGGRHWKRVPSRTSQLLTGVFFTDERRGWVVGANGTVLFSEDGGERWSSRTTAAASILF